MRKFIKIFILFSLICLIPSFMISAVRAKVYYHGDREEKCIYLTFDDGYTAKNTKEILDVLKEKNVPATFFIEGGFLTENPILAKRISEEQTLANHTFTHRDITKMSNDEFVSEIKKFEDEVLRITGKPVTKYFRPPMGIFNEEKLNVLGDLEYTVFMWDVSYFDYVPEEDMGIDFALENLLKQTTNGSIILMHTLTKSNADVLSIAIDELRQKGYVFASLEQLLKR